jgi:hypothetical protein
MKPKDLLVVDLRPVEPQVIVIDGKRYPVAHPETTSLPQVFKIERLRKKLAAIETLDDLSPQSEAEFAGLLDQLTRVLLPTAPDAVHGRLSDVHRLAITAAYIEAARARAAAGNVAVPKPRRPRRRTRRT